MSSLSGSGWKTYLGLAGVQPADTSVGRTKSASRDAWRPAIRFPNHRPIEKRFLPASALAGTHPGLTKCGDSAYAGDDRARNNTGYYADLSLVAPNRPAHDPPR